MTEDKFDKTLSLHRGALDYESLRDVDMIIEEGFFKATNFSDLENISHNTAYLQVTLPHLNLMEKTPNPMIELLEPISLAHVIPLLEIVHTNQISPQVIVDLLEVGKKIKKTPVVVGNCTGFAAVIEEKRAPHAVKAYAKDDPFNPTS